MQHFLNGLLTHLIKRCYQKFLASSMCTSVYVLCGVLGASTRRKQSPGTKS